MNTAPESLTFHPLDALQAMTLDGVEALWDLVPTERQQLYRAAYERTRRDEGASGSDALEAALLEQLIGRYADSALVPVGAYWVRTPPQIQELARSNTAPRAIDTGTAESAARPKPLLIGLGAVAALLVVLLLLRGVGGTARGTPGMTGTHAATPTLVRTWTPTPLALDAQDAIIRSGNSGSAAVSVYPVNLRVTVGAEAQPRVFVVQRRAVNTAEWVYDPNPDVAAYIAGLTVHPVLGIPWSQANADLFEAAVPGTVLTLRMNTGSTLSFVVRARETLGRADTGLFAQSTPGLTLVLLGEREVDPSLWTGQRAAITADYAPEAAPIAVSTPTATVAPTPVERVDVQVVSVTTQPGRMSCRLRMVNGTFEPLVLGPDSVWAAFGYAERPVGPRVAAALERVTVLPGQAADVTVVFAWAGEPFATVGVLDAYRFAVAVR